MMFPIAVLFSVPLSLLTLLSRQSNLAADQIAALVAAWGAWGLGVTMAAVFPSIHQLTRVTATHIDPPLRSFLSVLRRQTQSIAIADVEKVERRQGAVRGYFFHLRGPAKRWPEFIGEHNVEDFARFTAALRQVLPGFDTE